MKKVSLIAAWLAVAGMACGSDGDKKSDDVRDAGPSDGDAGEMCDGDAVEPYEDFDGPPVWTQQQQTACADACSMVSDAESDACIAANCPDYELFNQCVNGVLLSCLTSEGSDGDCREPWETYICCAETNCDEDAADDVIQACLDKNCEAPFEALNTCIDENGDPNARIPEPCIRKVLERCIKADAMPAMTSMSLSSGQPVDRLVLRNLRTNLRGVLTQKAR